MNLLAALRDAACDDICCKALDSGMHQNTPFWSLLGMELYAGKHTGGFVRLPILY